MLPVYFSREHRGYRLGRGAAGKLHEDTFPDKGAAYNHNICGRERRLESICKSQRRLFPVETLHYSTDFHALYQALCTLA